MEDFGHFQSCYNGPDVPPATSGCEDADIDGDGDVDMADFGEFSGCYNVANAPPACSGIKPTRYTWDAENRLTKVEPIFPASNDKKAEFTYDYMGRRVRKTVSTYGGAQWTEDSGGDQLFVYDQWNVVLVLNANASNATLRKYTWGLDLSGLEGNGTSTGIHGAGGIGGLLAAYETQGTETTADDASYWFLYDGNGNVGQVLDATDSEDITTAARYEYDAYGNVVGPDDDADGDWTDDATAYALANPIRFSTKWFDAETGLGYWGYRYYSPRLGRWMSRDPIEELGGLNLYECVGNDSVNNSDPLGLVPGAVTLHPGGITCIEYTNGCVCTATVTKKYLRFWYEWHWWPFPGWVLHSEPAVCPHTIRGREPIRCSSEADKACKKALEVVQRRLAAANSMDYLAILYEKGCDAYREAVDSVP